MRRSITLRKLSALTFFAVMAASPVRAETSGPITENTTAEPQETTELQIVNNYAGRVAVYLVGEQGARQYLGSVSRSHYRAFAVPTGSVTIQVLPWSAPAGLGVRDSQSRGIQTHAVELRSGQKVKFWIEPTLRRSTATISAA